MTVKIADILTPENWNEYGVVRTSELSALWQAGIVAGMDGISLPNGGGTINLPFFGDLTGDAELLSDSSPLTPEGIGTGKQIAAVLGRGKAWGVNDLAGVFAGADPAEAIISLIAFYWARQMQAELIALLTGMFGAASMAALVSDVSAEAAAVDNSFNGDTFIDATQLLGDAKGQVSAIAMHSATEAYLAKAKLIDYETIDGKSDRVPIYMGKRVIVDDGLPVSSGTYTSYIFGGAVVGHTEGTIGPEDLENDRDILQGDTVFAMRRRFLLHPKGMKWVGAPAGDFPSRAELAVGTNWERVFETKQIPIIQFKHKLTAA